MGNAATHFPSLRRIGPAVAPMLVLSLLIVSSAWADDPPIEIEVPVFEGREGLDFFLQCARQYEEIQPGVVVNLYGDPRIVDKVRVRILEGTWPEITNASPLNYWALIYNGDILPLDEFLDGPNWEGDRTWRESFLPGSLDRYTYQGKTYSIPFGYSIYITWYNKKMFRAHGWRPAKTWDEFLELCRKIKSAGIWPLAFQGRYPDYAQAIMDHAYYHLAGPAGYRDQQDLRPGSFANPQFERALDLTQKLAVNYFQPGAMGMSHTEAQLEFFLGHTAMIFCGSWLKSEMQGKIPEGFELGAFNLPVADPGQADPTAVNATSGYYVVFRNSRHPCQAVEFLRFMTSRRMAGQFCRQRDIPVAIRGGNEGNLSEDMADVVAIIHAAKTSYGIPPGEGFPEMEQYWSDVRLKVLTHKITPAQAAARLEEAAKAVRDKSANPDHVTVRHVVKPLVLLGIIGAAILFGLAAAGARLWKALQSRAPPPSAGRTRLSGLSAVIFIGPAALLYTVLVIVPSLKSFGWSLYRWNGLTEMVSVGLLHYKRLLFESDGMWVALKNNLFIMLVVPLFVLPLSLFLAACISRGVRGSKGFRIVYFFPNVLGTVAVTLLWLHIYNPQSGVVNAALAGLGRAISAIGLSHLGGYLQGFQGFAWLSQDHLYWSLIPMFVWGACGFNMILFLAAMESIPPSLYEAAEIDGASSWRQFWTITVPLIWDVLCIAIVFMIIGGMKTFEVIWLLTNQSPTTETHVISTRMVQTMFVEFKVGEATAIAVLLFLMIFFGTVATLRILKRERVEY